MATSAEDLDDLRTAALKAINNGGSYCSVDARTLLNFVSKLTTCLDAIAEAVAQLDAEHYPGADCGPRNGCVMCWPKDGSWPCVTRMVADDLRKLAGG